MALQDPETRPRGEGRSVYVVAPGPLGPVLRDAFPGGTTLGSAAELRPLEGREPGAIVLEAATVPPAEALDLARDAADARDGWLVVLARPGDGGPELRPLSLGWPAAPSDLSGEGAVVFHLGAILSRVARARHDLNNPLTSAMAETQLLLMDAPPAGELREGLETIQTQLRRIRDMVADLRTLRRPD